MVNGITAFVLVFFLFLNSGVFAGNPDPYKILRKVPTYSDLLNKGKIKTYSVPVRASGKLWDEIEAAAHCKGAQIKLTEYYKAPNTVSLRIGGCASELNLIPGVIDPVQVFRILLKELESYKERKVFYRLKKQSKAIIEKKTDTYLIMLKPRNGKYILNEYHDSGTETVVTKIEWLNAEIYVNTNLIKVLEIKKETLLNSMEANLNSSKISVVKLKFAYLFWHGNFFPQKLSVWQNGEKKLSLSAKYKEQDGRLLPQQKVLEYSLKQKPETVVLDYGKYNIDIPLSENELSVSLAASNVLQKANGISLKVQDAVVNGRVMEARRRMNLLADHYSDTPQGRQAKAFLDGMPQ